MVKIALLRGINVGGNRIIPMAELRGLTETLGFKNVASYIQSGNLVFETSTASSDAERKLEQGIEKRFGFFVEVMVRDAKEWAKFLKPPFAQAAKARANLLHLGIAKKPFAPGTEKALQARAKNEHVKLVGQALWIDYVDGAGRSKLNPAVIDRAAGSTVTLRNWKTVQRLFEMCRRPS